MFVAEKLIYLQMQKTGSSHITRLLEEVVGGERQTKHSRLESDPGNRLVIGSVRNPWDWYVSLWAFGCSGRGAIWNRVTRPRLDRFWRRDPTGPKNLTSRVRTSLASLGRPVERWRSVYADSQDPALFRAWLAMLLGDARRIDADQGYGLSRFSPSMGLMTYRYLWLHWKSVEPLYHDHDVGDLDAGGPDVGVPDVGAHGGEASGKSVAAESAGMSRAEKTYALMRDIDARNNWTRGEIRNENLEADLKRMLERAGYALTREQLERIDRGRENPTMHSTHRETSEYYDEASVDLVAEQDRFMIEKFGYSRPEL